MILEHRCNQFLKQAQKEPFFEPEEADFHFGPEDDDYEYSKMEGITTSEPGSNYGRLTEPLPSLQEDEQSVFASMVGDLEYQTKPLLHDLEKRFYAVNAASSFLRKAKQALIDVNANIIASFDAIRKTTYTEKSIEDVISDVKDNVRSIQHLRTGLRRLIEADRENEPAIDLSMLSRLSDRLSIIGLDVLRRLQKLHDAARRKHVGKSQYEWV